MRRLLIVLAVALIAGAGVYQFLIRQEGFLVLSAGPYVVETSLWGALVIILAALAVFFVLWKFWRLVVMPRHWWRRHQGRRQLRVRDQTAQGVLDYLGGDWPKAVANLEKGTGRSDTPAINYLGAAAASFNLGDNDRAAALLRQAEANGASDPVTAGLLKVRMLLQENDFGAALALGESLHRKHPSHPTVLRLLAAARKGLRDWHGLEAMLPDLKKHRALSSSELAALDGEVYRGLVEEFDNLKSANRSAREQQVQLDSLWDRVPRRLQGDPDLVAAYADQLRRLGFGNKAESRLRRFINRHWDNRLVELYGRIEEDPRHQLTVAEGWLKDHPEDAALHRTLARLCMRNKLWGKAREYFEAALRLESSPGLWLELGELLQVLQDERGSRECFRKGLDQAVAAARH